MIWGEPSLLIAHFADTHLGAKLYGLNWTLEAILQHFREAFEKALNEHVDAIVFSGDLFDKPRPLNTVIKTVSDLVSEAVDRGIRVYCVLGEHDLPKSRDIPPQQLIPGIKLFAKKQLYECIDRDGRTYCFGGVSHHPLKYGERVRRDLLRMIDMVNSKLNKYSVLMLHQNISNFFMYEPGLDLNDLPGKPLYIAMGHLHRRIVHRRGDQVIAYPGSLDILRRDEISEWKSNGKGFYLVDLSGDSPEVSKIDVEVIPQEIVKATLSDLNARIGEAVKNLPLNKDSILHVDVSLKLGEQVDVYSLVRNIVRRYADKIHFRISRTYVDEAISISETGLENIDEVDVIAEYLDPKNKGHVRELARSIVELKNALLNGNEEVLDKIVEEISKHPYWSRKIKYSYITLEEIDAGGVRGEVKRTAGRRSGRNLLSYLGESGGG